MKEHAIRLLAGIAISGSMLVLASCGGGSGGDSGSPSVTPEVNKPMVANDFTFPEVSEADGQISVNIPEGPVPDFSARRTLASGTGELIEYGDPVVLNYKMFSWSTGDLVESSDTLDEAVALQAGVTAGVPEYLSKSLLGRNIGDKLQIVFQREMEDLPSYLDKSDAYVVVVELI